MPKFVLVMLRLGGAKRTQLKTFSASACSDSFQVSRIANSRLRLTLWFEFVPVYGNRDVCIAVIRS